MTLGDGHAYTGRGTRRCNGTCHPEETGHDHWNVHSLAFDPERMGSHSKGEKTADR
jgi:hypothetical protein